MSENNNASEYRLMASPEPPPLLGPSRFEMQNVSSHHHDSNANSNGDDARRRSRRSSVASDLSGASSLGRRRGRIRDRSVRQRMEDKEAIVEACEYDTPVDVEAARHRKMLVDLQRGVVFRTFGVPLMVLALQRPEYVYQHTHYENAAEEALEYVKRQRRAKRANNINNSSSSNDNNNNNTAASASSMTGPLMDNADGDLDEYAAAAADIDLENPQHVFKNEVMSEAEIEQLLGDTVQFYAGTQAKFNRAQSNYVVGSSTRFCIHRALVSVFVSWTFIGWCLHLLLFAEGYTELPLIPGWYESLASRHDSIPTGIMLSGMNMFFYFFGCYYFSRHSAYLCRLMDDVFSHGEYTMHCVQHRAIKLVRWCWILSITLMLIGQVNTIIIANSNHHSFLDNNVGLLFYDFVVTMLTFWLQFFVLFVMASYFSFVCHLHVMQIEQYTMFLTDREYTSSVAAARFRHILANVRLSSNRFTPLLTGVVILHGGAWAFFLLNILVRDSHLAVALRGFYFAVVLGPVILILTSAARVTTALGEVLVTATSLPPQEGKSRMRGYLNSLFMIAQQSGQMGFRVLGIPLSRAVLIRMLYVLGLAVSALVQLNLSKHDKPDNVQ
eukprot:TRINITY_DN66328_c3_g1_i1.p1 TRINITY_DN66328_c3_g1~~TRINITY_DN66328_c3_g1_i1.p1  ORF type:complete len:611 (+),score=274.64 TRINITY_DN66328_c3_g1_i1:70-1902(+)